MSNETQVAVSLKSPTLLLGMAAVTIILSVLLLWPAPPNELGVQNTSNAASPAHSGMAKNDSDSAMQNVDPHAGHSHQSMEAKEGMMSPDPHAGQRMGLTQKTEVWSCSMHPQIQRENPGNCPICGMKLIPVRTDSSSGGKSDRSLTISPAQRALMRIATVPVERRFPTAKIRLVGKITYDETRLAYITAWVPGRIDNLLVDYTGVTVQEGDHMVELFSPELLSAQEELLQAVRGFANLSKSSVQSLRNSAQGTVESARDRLRLWGLTTDQIRAIEHSGEASENVTIYSPASGVVIHRDAQEGMYVETGTRIFTIADLDAVWVQLDAYESDLQWLGYGQKVSFTTEAFPGETFRGVVSFIDPVLDPRTRTVKVRVNADNTGGRLKPEMFVRATVSAQIASHGKMIDRGLVGKWVSPMHPEIVKDEPGQCDICGMDLVPAESLGYVNSEDAMPPLVIPATAPLLTGTRAVVYVEDQSADRPTYVGKEIVLGPRAGPDYVVESGLSEGDLVVVSGNFKIDSALQIQAKPSMMNPKGGGSGGGHDHGGQ